MGRPSQHFMGRCLGKRALHLGNLLHSHHMLCQVLSLGLLLALAQEQRLPKADVCSHCNRERLGYCSGKLKNMPPPLESRALSEHDLSVDPCHYFPMPAGERILDSLYGRSQHVCQMPCQCEPVLQREFYPQHHHGRCASAPSPTPNLGAEPPEDSKACCDVHFCARNIVSWGLNALSCARIPAKILVSVLCVSITRFTFILKLNIKSPDVTWNFVNTQIWTTVESHIGIACGELKPSLDQLYYF